MGFRVSGVLVCKVWEGNRRENANSKAVLKGKGQRVESVGGV